MNLIYRYFLINIFCLLPVFCFAQKTYDGQVIDKATEDPIPNVNVTLIKEKTGTQTNAHGYFELSSEKSLLNDTLQFSFIGYKTFKLPVSEYQAQIIIILEASNTLLDEVRIDKKRKLKNIVLDKFASYDLKDFRGTAYVENGRLQTHSHITEVVKSQTVLAKFFKAPNANARLINIALGRQDLHTSPTYSVRNKLTTFLVHVMTQDTTTGAPGKILYTKTVSLTDNSLWVDIDLSNEKIIIPARNFFVAVEWLINPYNEIIGVNNAPKVAKTTRHGLQIIKDASDYYVWYQPFLVGYDAQDDTRKHATLYIKNDNQWQLFAHSTSELALSATIHY